MLEIDGKNRAFYVDEKLEQYRCVKNPHEFIPFEDVDGTPEMIMEQQGIRN